MHTVYQCSVFQILKQVLPICKEYQESPNPFHSLSIDWPGPCYISNITMVLRASVNQNQISAANSIIVVNIMKSIGSADKNKSFFGEFLISYISLFAICCRFKVLICSPLQRKIPYAILPLKKKKRKT